MNYSIEYYKEKDTDPMVFLQRFRCTTEPIGGGTEQDEEGELVSWDAAVAAIEIAKKQPGWHPASELPPKSTRIIEGNEPDWQHYRIQAAIAAMDIVKGAYNIHEGVEQLVQHSVRIADALIEELKRKNDVYAEARRQNAINTAAVCENMTRIQKELQKKGGQDDSQT